MANITLGKVMVVIIVVMIMMIMMMMKRRRRKPLCSAYTHMSKVRLISVKTI
jgi:hypothetical protein